MSNLKKRIEGLITSTASVEAKTACNEALNKYSEYSKFNLTSESLTQVEASIAESLIPVLESITDSAVEDFLTVEKRIIGMNNLGVKAAIKSIKESTMASHPTFIYVAERLSKLESYPEWMVAEQVAEQLSAYAWEPVVKECLNTLNTNIKKYAEDINIYRAVDEAKNSRSEFLVSGLQKTIDAYLNNRSASNRKTLLENLSKYLYDPNIKNLYNVVLESEKSFQLKANNNDAVVTNVYSPIIVNEDEEIFAVHGKPYIKKGNDVRPLVQEEIEILPNHFTAISSFLSQPNVEVKENAIRVFTRDKKVELVEETEGLGIYINGKKVTMNEFHSAYLNSGIFRFEEKDVISAVNLVAENWDSIFELDFVKSIFPKHISNRRADVFNLDGKTHIYTVDGMMKEEKFYADCNVTQSRNLVLEFASFDLGLSFKEFLKEEEKTITKLQESKKEYFDAITYLEERQRTLELIEDEEIRESAEVKELIAAISEEISSLKESYYEVQNKINSLTTVSEGATVGDEAEYLKKK